MHKVLIADDHPLIRDSLIQVLRGLDDSKEFAEAADFYSCCRCLDATPDIDLILLDLFMPGMRGMQSIRELRKRSPATPLVVVSACEDIEEMHAVMQSGAMGYIPKSSSSKILRSAVQLVLAGGLYYPPQLHAAEVLNPDSPGLTARQREIVGMLSTGLTNKQIARALSISDKTVKAHLSEVFRRLGASNRTQAVHVARTEGLLERTTSGSSSETM